MFDNQDKVILFIAEKETFMARVLENKIKEAGFECAYCGWDENELALKWSELELAVVYTDNGGLPPEKIIRLINDKMINDNTRVTLVGDKQNVKTLSDKLQNVLIYKKFISPVDNVEFFMSIFELSVKTGEGDAKKTILIVDDDPGYMWIVRDWLKNLYKVDMVGSGLQAIKWLGKNKTDLILLDYEMPVTSGPEVLKMLRSDEDTKRIPVFFLTGRSDKESVMNVMAYRPEGYILKTVEKNELLEKLNDFFMTRQ
ncbi:MAG: response regulator [Lachnospiraceae bacterium]|nr:response regulator [Lachnospiraceae bacterium]